jgi:hypothetical protein
MTFASRQEVQAVFRLMRVAVFGVSGESDGIAAGLVGRTRWPSRKLGGSYLKDRVYFRFSFMRVVSLKLSLTVPNA